MKVAVIGAGKLGTNITEVLTGGGHEITLIDWDDAAIRRVQSTSDIMTVKADARSARSLKELDIASYDLLAATTDNDETNIFICAMAKKLGCRMVIARVRGPEHMDQLELIQENFGIDYAVNPDLTCASEIYKFLSKKSGLNRDRFELGSAEILEFDVERLPALAGKKLRDASSLLQGMLIAAVSRNGRIIVPNGSTGLLPHDSLYAICQSENAAGLKKQLLSGGRGEKLRRVMIAGGGRTAFFLAGKLREVGAAVKIIELDRDRCEYLSRNLDNVLVLHGRAQDVNLLRDENLDGMDAFVAATDSDETNILLSIMAQQHSVPMVAAKVGHSSFSDITGVFDDTMLVNAVDMCTADVLRYAEKQESILFSKVIQGQAEFMEILASEGMPLTEKPLKDLTIPDGVLIATVRRGSEVIIPGGLTHIRPGDKVILLSLLSAAGSLEALLNRSSTHTL